MKKNLDEKGLADTINEFQLELFWLHCRHDEILLQMFKRQDELQQEAYDQFQQFLKDMAEMEQFEMDEPDFGQKEDWSTPCMDQNDDDIDLLERDEPPMLDEGDRDIVLVELENWLDGIVADIKEVEDMLSKLHDKYFINHFSQV